VTEISDTLIQEGIKAGRCTGKMKPKDRKLADKKYFQGDTPVLVATEAFELWVDNSNVIQVIHSHGVPTKLVAGGRSTR